LRDLEVGTPAAEEAGEDHTMSARLIDLCRRQNHHLVSDVIATVTAAGVLLAGALALCA
jgi:hypothetical protein